MKTYLTPNHIRHALANLPITPLRLIRVDGVIELL